MCVGGVDYICVDQQHGLVDYSEMVGMLIDRLTRVRTRSSG